MKKWLHKSLGDKTLDVIIHLVLTVISLVTFYIFWYCIVGAFSTGDDFMNGKSWFWPEHFTFDNFKAVIADSDILHAFLISVLRTVIGTVLSVLFTALVAYGMTRPQLKYKNFYSVFMIITMFFSGGTIPTFLLYDGLGLLDNFWVYVIPGLFSVYNMIIVRNSMKEIPASLLEAARIDGCSEYRIFWQIVLPMSKSTLMAIALFNAVGHWNSYFDTMMFTSDPNLQTAQYYLYNMIVKADKVTEMLNQGVLANPDVVVNVSSQSVRMAAVVVISLPILIVYPFIQKHFVKGVMIGSVKE